MAGIRGKDTKPEITIRKLLHGAGFRFRLHSSVLPGKPDLILPRHRVAIFVHGCYWHGHDCHLFRLPATRREFWRKKIDRNRMRDREVRDLILEKEFRHLTVWECALRGKTRREHGDLLELMSGWISGSESTGEIRGTCTTPTIFSSSDCKDIITRKGRRI